MPDQATQQMHIEAPLERIWSAAVSIDVTDDVSTVREMALAGCTGVFVGFESLTDENLADARRMRREVRDAWQELEDTATDLGLGRRAYEPEPAFAHRLVAGSTRPQRWRCLGRRSRRLRSHPGHRRR